MMYSENLSSYKETKEECYKESEIGEGWKW